MESGTVKTVNGYKIEEYYWNGKIVVYVNNTKTDKTFKEACDFYENAKELEMDNYVSKLQSRASKRKAKLASLISENTEHRQTD